LTKKQKEQIIKAGARHTCLYRAHRKYGGKAEYENKPHLPLLKGAVYLRLSSFLTFMIDTINDANAIMMTKH
jgi:hypothetical protein